MGKLKWRTRRGNAISAPLSYAGDFVISHRHEWHTASYRPPGKHVHLGVFLTKKAAREFCESLDVTTIEIVGEGFTQFLRDHQRLHAERVAAGISPR